MKIGERNLMLGQTIGLWAPVAEPFSLVSILSPEVKDLLEIEMGGGAK